QSRPQTGRSLRGHPELHARLAFTPNDRGLSVGHCTALSAAGPRQIIWSGLSPSPSNDGAAAWCARAAMLIGCEASPDLAAGRPLNAAVADYSACSQVAVQQ